MILKSLALRSLGSVRHLSLTLSHDLCVLRERHLDELSYALRTVLHHKMSPAPVPRVYSDTRIEAEVHSGGRIYSVLATPCEENGELHLVCRDELGAVATQNYLHITSHCPEEDMSDVFDGRGEDILLGFLKYANEDIYYSPHELTRATDGLSDLKAFRAYLRAFIRDFEPEPVRDGRGYEIILEKSGRYAVRCRVDGSITRVLSASERTLFRYLCFLRTAEFWRGFEELRNLHAVKKPLLVSGFLERLDETIDVTHLLTRTKNLGRQVIILTNCNSRT